MASGNASEGVTPSPLQTPPQWLPDERDAFISWLRGEFAAANAIIDALCQHLHTIGMPGDYDYVLSSIHHRRFNWNSVLHLQQYYSVGEVVTALHQVGFRKHQQMQPMLGEPPLHMESLRITGDPPRVVDAGGNEVNLRQPPFLPEKLEDGPSPKRAFKQPEDVIRPRAPKYVIGVEEIEGQQVNVLDGLELHEHVLDAREVSEIAVSVHEYYSTKSNGKGKHMIQFGTIPSEIFAEGKASGFREETAEEMPTFLQSVVDRLVDLRIVPADKPPDACSVSVLEVRDYMPPHNHRIFEEPVVILALNSDSTFVFGRALRMKNSGDIEGPFKLTLTAGSVLLLQGNSARAVECAVAPSEKPRMLVTFGRGLRPQTPRPTPRMSPASMDSLGFVQAFPPLRPVVSPPQTTVPGPSTMVRPVVPGSSTAVRPVGPRPPLNVVTPPPPAGAPPTSGGEWSPRGTGVFLPPNGTSHPHMNGGAQRSRSYF